MDVLLGVLSIIIFLVSLLIASGMDLRTGEVPNRVWGFSLTALPVAIFRLFITGALLLYTLYNFMMFGFVLLCFYIGLIGGADGKAILVSSCTYPWISINTTTLVWSPSLILMGGFMIAGVQCLLLVLRNIRIWYKYSPQQRKSVIPERKRYWCVRRLSYGSAGSKVDWERVAVPLVFYLLIVYLVLMFWQILF